MSAAAFDRRGREIRVKICGITRLADAQLAVDLGADALGFNFWPRSHRYCDPALARQIIGKLPPLVSVVAVFVNQSRREIDRICSAVCPSALQLHGNESPDFCQGFEWPVIKAIPVNGPESLRACEAYRVSAFLMDTPSRSFGGSGRTFPWKVLAAWPDSRPILLAGGLTAENVRRAVRLVRPYGVDVASGVESAPGIKSAKKMARFIAAAKRALLES
jgi:phosphoribosylanthranilate isomerase